MSGVTVQEFAKNSRERVRISLDEWQGHHLVDIRVTTQLCAETPDVWSPTKKGVSLNVGRLPEMIDALRQAEVRAREQGLIGGDP